MIQKKICLLGAFSVGKTSLIKRFVDSLFDEKYLTTVGVKVDKKAMVVNGTDLTLMIWDLAGEDDYSKLRTSYLRGASGYILVADGTRPNSLETALQVHETARGAIGAVPFVLALNKADLADQWQLTDSMMGGIDADITPVRTSAKTGDNVEQIFETLAEQML